MPELGALVVISDGGISDGNAAATLNFSICPHFIAFFHEGTGGNVLNADKAENAPPREKRKCDALTRLTAL